VTELPARGAPRRSRLSAAERRASIVTAATKVFSEVGYQHGKMSDVARLVGVSEPVIFQNFGSKGAVFAAVIEEATGRMTAAMTEVAANGSVGAWLTGLLAPGHLSHAHAHAAHHVLFADAMSYTSEPMVKEAIRRGHRAVAQTLTDLLTRGQAEGSVRPDLDPQTAAWWLLSLLATQGFRAATMPNHAHQEAKLGAMTLQMLMTNRHGPG
jgi:AcrR family transcriptional regulator